MPGGTTTATVAVAQTQPQQQQQQPHEVPPAGAQSDNDQV